MKTLRAIVLVFAALLLTAVIPALGEENVPVILDASAPESHAGDLTLTDVILSRDSAEVGSRAFAGCKNLGSVYIPLGLSNLADDAFEGCEGLTLYGYVAENWAYPEERGLKYVNLTQESSDGFLYAVDFEDGSCAITGYRGGAEALAIPEEIDGHAVTEIYEQAFNRCVNLTSVVVPSCVRSIGHLAFQYCTGLTEVTLSEGLETLEGRAFYYCSGLETLDLPASLTTVGDNPVAACFKLTAINVAEGNTAYISEDGVLYDAALTRLIAWPCGKAGSLSIPSGVRVIGQNTFENCAKIEAVEIPGTVTTIEDRAFWNCGVSEISLPGSVETIECNPFGASFHLSRFEVSPENPYFTAVDGALFSKDMTRLICAPAGTAGRYAIPDGVERLEEHAFEAAGYEEIAIPASVADIGYYALASEQLESILVSEDSPNYSDSDGILYDKDVTEIIRVPKAKKGRVVVPEGITELGLSVFANCADITEIILPEGLTSIGMNAIASVRSMTSISIPSTVTAMERFAFRACESLETIALPEGIETIMGSAFEDCAALRSVSLPSGLKTIEEYAFSGCESLRHLTVPAGVTFIDYTAFSNCENLTLHGEAGSYAEQFAAENGIPFTTEPEPEPGEKPAPDSEPEPAVGPESDVEANEALAEYETLQKGSKGEAVKALQLKLIELGFLNGEAYGDYGRMTTEAVSAFQRSAALPETGVADAETQRAVFGK